ncbi:hypothetical protein ACWCXK_12655 [Streptomyces sp. NPDC001739]|uniref:hypothetical protein n=1 Tax=unclassified Streptomyces TaxID=2593676 RepID=UPI0036B10B53
MRAKIRSHRIVAALCAVPFLVLAGAGAASAVPAAAPAAAPTHASAHGWSCDDNWRWGGDCYDHFGYDHFGYGHGISVIIIG